MYDNISQTKEPTMVLNEVAKVVETITDQRLQRNIAAASTASRKSKVKSQKSKVRFRKLFRN